MGNRGFKALVSWILDHWKGELSFNGLEFFDEHDVVDVVAFSLTV
jgi:hypothetical protein